MTDFHQAEVERLKGFGGTAQESGAHVVTDLQERLRRLILEGEPIPPELQGAFHRDRFATLKAAYEAERDKLILTCPRCERDKRGPEC